MIKMSNLILFLLTGVWWVTVWSNPEAESKMPFPQSVQDSQISQNFLLSYDRIVYTILFFLGILLIAFFIMRKAKQVLPNKKSPFVIKVLNNYPLGHKKYLSVVQVAGETLLLGVTDHNINLIKDLTVLDEEIQSLSENEAKRSSGNSDNVGTDVVKKKFAQLIVEKSSDKHNYRALENATEEEFSIKEIADLVKDKVRSMRELG
ncbi:MAG: flagellar biosynthetic protein FliO [Bdellovibrionaceae bacterium]|nr:flagellar biosynthetic protein FliO [Pseudobdellovibrionaceae bacterium]MDW8190849.1 flagellar biosynthetic protein FliO [Pseudobdellovibrionaceae bacterium]